MITLREKGKYRALQEAMNTVYTNDRADYASDVVFANFRAMTGGSLAEGLFYRSASPCDDQHHRASFVSALCEEAGIGYVLDLADSEEELAAYTADDGLDCAYWKELYARGKVLPLAMSSNYRGEAFARSMVEALRAVLREEGPFLLHCTEGKDRTGFARLLVEALAGATPEEVERDYMVTYANYYGVTAEKDPETYRTIREIRFEDFLFYLCDGEEVTAERLRQGAEDYLIAGGMTAEEIARLEEKITAAAK